MQLERMIQKTVISGSIPRYVQSTDNKTAKDTVTTQKSVMLMGDRFERLGLATIANELMRYVEMRIMRE